MADTDPTQPVGDSSAQPPEPGGASQASKPSVPPTPPPVTPPLSPQAAAKASAAEAALAAAQAAIDSLNLGTELPDLSPAQEPAPEPAARPAAVGRAPGVVPAGTATGAVPLDLPSLTGEIEPAAARAIDLLSDVNMHVKIELGRTRMYVEDVLRLSEGAVVELDKLAGDPVDIYVNDRHIARGEVLVLNDNFCVRIHEIIKAVEGNDHARAG